MSRHEAGGVRSRRWVPPPVPTGGAWRRALVLVLWILASAPGMAQTVYDASPVVSTQVREILSGNLILEASQNEAVDALAALGEAGGIAMAKYLPSKVTTVSITLREAYVKLGAKASAGLRLGLEGEAREGRRMAMYFLSEIGDPVDRDVFMAHLNDTDDAFRALAARGLVGAATEGDAGAEAALLAVLDATNAALRKWSTLALGTWGSAQVVPALAKRLRDESWTVRWDAAWGLAEEARRGASDGVEAVVRESLASPDPHQRALAAHIIGQAKLTSLGESLHNQAEAEDNPTAFGYQVKALSALGIKASRASGDPFVQFMRR